MKKRLLISLVSVVLTLSLTGCSDGKCSKNAKCVNEWSSTDVKEITIYLKDANGNKGVAGIVQDQMEIDIFVKAMQTAEPIPGDFKVSPPDYEAKIVLKDNKTSTLPIVKLWLPSETEGMIVYSTNSSQGYKLTMGQTKEIRGIIESNRIHPAK
jgi:hypothetical protein